MPLDLPLGADLTEDVQTRIDAAVDDFFDEEVRFLADFVAIPSERGREAPAQDYMADALRARGYTVDHWKIDPADLKDLPGYSPVMDTSYEGAYSVNGTHRPASVKGRSLILQGHCDVVPAGPLEMWDIPPYSPVIKDGWMNGRGACDMKSGTVSALFALDALRKAGFEPAATVHFQSVIEEECTGNGALSTLQRGYRADLSFIPEPTKHTLTRAEVGVIWFKLRVRGLPVHVAYAGTGSNAIEAGLAVAQSVHQVADRWNEKAKTEPHFEHMDHPINYNIGMVQGGDWASSVPAWVEIHCRIGILPSQTIAECQAEIVAQVQEAARQHPFLANNPPEILWNGFLADGYVLTGADEAEKLLGAVHNKVVGEPMGERTATGLTDARFYGLYYDIPGVVWGPSGENVHGFNERVDLESVRRSTKVIARFVAGWCGFNAL